MRFARLVNLLHRVRRNRVRRNRRRASLPSPSSQPLLTDTNLIDGIDRLSELSDDILCNILSDIDSKYAILTCFLLKRLKTLAPYLPNIILDDSVTGPPYNRLECAWFGIRQIFLRRGRKIGKFELKCHGNLGDSAFQTLIRVVARENVKEINVKFESGIDFGPIPEEVFNCAKLEVLKLAGRHLAINVPYSLDLPELKVLCFEEVDIPFAEDMTGLFQACSKLEELYLLGVSVDHHFDISCQLLTKVSLNLLGNDIGFNIDTPNLKVFEYEGHAPTVHVSSEFKSLDRVVLRFTSELYYGTIDDKENLSTFPNNLHGLNGLKSLHLSNHAFKAISSQSPIYESLKILNFHAGNPRKIFDILQLTPKLEVLVIHSYFLGKPYQEDAQGTSHMMTASVPVCLEENLRIIKFEEFKVDGKVFHLVKYLLANGKSLQTLKISALFANWTTEMEETRNAILGLPRGSGTCNVVFNPPKPE